MDSEDCSTENTPVLTEKAPQFCVDCHFFMKECRDRGPVLGFNANDEEREKARRNDFSWAQEHWALCCAHTVWDQGYDLPQDKRHEVICDTDRRDLCFFWRYRPGMLLQAAKTLQEREAAYREASRDRVLTLVGLWIAAGALAVDVLLRLFKV